tara:strand:- start:141 stop:470 length:330 start_codon:yes stop_codon:yes gene_type:complete
MVKVEGIAVDGTIVAQLNNKVFEVISKPQYTEFEDEGITRRKATFRIKSVENEAEYDYYPNKTSIKTLVKMHGDEMDEWVEKRFEFLVTPQMVRGEEKKVLYVKYNEGV